VTEIVVEDAEFAVYVDTVGAVEVHTPNTYTVGADEPTMFLSADEALRVAERVSQQYRQLGVPAVADMVYVAARTVRVTREPWRRISTSASVPA
jgi:hypothetical protein